MVATAVALTALSCESLGLGVGVPTRRHRRRPLHQSVEILQRFRPSRALLSSKQGGDDHEIHQNNDGSLEGAKREVGSTRSVVSAVRTALASFAAGSLFAVILSMILFHQSLVSDGQTPLYQNAGVSRSAATTRFNANIPSAGTTIGKQVVLYKSIMQQLEAMYVDDVDPMMLFETTTRAMLSRLDPYTSYISPQDIRDRQALVGIGAFVMKPGDQPDTLNGKSISELVSLVPSPIALPSRLPRSQPQSNGFRVLFSLPGYAYDAGLRMGDEILEIDNESVVGDTLEKVRELLLGPPGTKVSVKYRRPGIRTTQTIDIERKVVQYKSVPFAGVLDGHKDIGYIRLRRFGLDAGVSMKRAIQSIQSDQRLKVSQIVLIR